MNKPIFKLIYLILTLSGNFLYAQTTVKGIVTDSASNPLPQINIIATLVESGDIVAYTYTGNSGQYELQLKNEDIYSITFSSLSYAKENIDVKATGGIQIIVHNIILQEQETQLDEVLLKGDRAIIVKKDTVIFDAEAFSRGNETVVEDLLKNIPGLEIDDEGTIKVGGREVEKVMVDYDDFFDKGYRILTKNMAANAIDKVEVLDKYSNNRLLKGIENSNKVALNLTLKEDKRNVWFGNTSLGYGLASENRYDVNANLMSFGKNNKFYFLTSLNNTGKDVSGDLTYVINPNRFDEPGTLGNNQSANSLLNLTGYNPGLKQKRVNFNNVELFSLNSIFTLNSKLKLKALGLLKTDENKFFKNGYETFLLNRQKFTNTEDYTLMQESLTGFGQIDLTYNVSKKAMFEYIGKYNNAQEDTKTDLLFNQEFTNETLEERKELIDQKAVYSNKFEENKVLIITGRFIEEKIPQKYHVNQFFFEDLFLENEDIQGVSQISENHMRYAGLEGHLLDKNDNGNLLEIKAGFTSRKDKLDSRLLLEQENLIFTPEDYANNLSYTRNNLYLKSHFIYKFNSVLINFNLDLYQLYNTLDFIGEEKNIEKPFFLNPQLGFEWNINDKNRLAASYAYNIKNSEILDVYNSYILNSYRSFLRGTGNFDQLNASYFSLNYRLGNWNDRFFAYTSLNYNKNHDFFSTSSFVQPDFVKATKILINDREMLSGNINMERYFKSLFFNLKLNTGFVKSNYQNIVNSNLRNVDFSNYNYGFEIRSGFASKFNFNLGTTWRHNTITTEIENSFTNNESFLNLTFIANKNLNFQLDTESYYFGNLSEGESRYNFLDFDTNYTIKGNKLSFSLQARNLLNTQIFRSYSITDISFSKNEIRLLPRFVLLKIDYTF